MTTIEEINEIKRNIIALNKRLKELSNPSSLSSTQTIFSMTQYEKYIYLVRDFKKNNFKTSVFLGPKEQRKMKAIQDSVFYDYLDPPFNNFKYSGAMYYIDPTYNTYGRVMLFLTETLNTSSNYYYNASYVLDQETKNDSLLYRTCETFGSNVQIKNQIKKNTNTIKQTNSYQDGPWNMGFVPVIKYK